MADLEDIEITVPTRGEIREQHIGLQRLRYPGLDTGTNTLAAFHADVIQDVAAPIYAAVSKIGLNATAETKTGKALEQEALNVGIAARLPATGASGFVKVQTGATGGTLVAGQEGTIGAVRYRVTLTKLYLSGEYVPVEGIDTGPGTNQPPGATLTWSSPPPGILPSALVAELVIGEGLTGGRDQEKDPELLARIREAKANPPASGNAAQYISAIRKTPGIPFQAIFVYPAIKGAGTKAFCFTVAPSTPGGSRIPSGTQLALALAWVKGQMPEDDVIFPCTLVAENLAMHLRVVWGATADGWEDATPWPAYVATPPSVVAAPTPTATTFRVDVSTAGAPVVGQTIALLDKPNKVWRRKRVLTVTFVAGTQYDLVMDTAANASDTTYAPFSGQIVSPWSKSLDLVAPTLLTELDTLGPGEQKSTFFDPGSRERRIPAAPEYPSTITNRNIAPLFKLAALGDVVLASPTVPYATPVGSVATSSKLFQLYQLGIFPQ
jgi:hypothetical protein